MNYINAQLSVIKGAMFTLSRGAAYGSLASLNLLPEDLKLVQQDFSWQNVERGQVTRVLEVLMHGTTDALGLPRIETPAEYVAAAIIMFVHPSNILVACRWMEGGFTSESLGNPSNASAQLGGVITSQQLFSLCLQLSNDIDLPAIRAQFEQRVNGSINSVMGDIENAKESTSIVRAKK